MKEVKKKIIISIFVLSFMIISPVFAESFFGNYKVDFEYKMAVTSGKGFSGKNIEPIVSIRDGIIALPPFVFSEKMVINSFEIKGVAISEKDGVIILQCKNFVSNDGKYVIKGNNLYGFIKDGKLNLKVSYKAGKMPFKLELKYTSKKD